MTVPIVGAGIAKRMAQYGTTPATAEDYRPRADAWEYSEAFGQDGRRYVFLRSTGAVLVFDYDSSIAAGGGPDPAPNVPIVQVPSPNFWPTRQGYDAIALVIHTMGGSLAGTDSWFKNPASQVSAHYGVGIDGKAHQYVSLAAAAWANGVLEPGNVWPGAPGVNPNLLTVSVETEDNNNPAQIVTADQYNATLGCCRLALARYPSIRYILRHTAISPATRPSCPGPRWVASGALASLAKALGLEMR